MNERILTAFDEPSCNSDDEAVALNGVVTYHVKPKEARSASVTAVARQSDHARLRLAELDGRSSYRQERARTPAVAPHNLESISKRLPRNTTIDWFDPDFFNNMPATFRARYWESEIALPLAHRLSEDLGQDWKTMDYGDFMEKYGDEVKKLYKLPTAEEVEAMEAAEVADAFADDKEFDAEEGMEY